MKLMMYFLINRSEQDMTNLGMLGLEVRLVILFLMVLFCGVL